MYQTKDNFKGFPMAMFFLMMLAQLYSHSCLGRTQEEWLPHMDFAIPPLCTADKPENSKAITDQATGGQSARSTDKVIRLFIKTKLLKRSHK